MKWTDLGEVKGTVLAFGGPYSNLEATQALIAQARALAIPPEHCICTGDVVAYCANPVESLQAIQDFGCPVIAGNCERQLATRAPDCGCGFEEGTTCDLLSVAWYSHADQEVSQAQRDWMADLPDMVTFQRNGMRYGVVHGGASDVARFLWPSSSEAEFLEEFAVIEAVVGKVDVVLAGHCGLAFARDIAGRRWINAGAIGMPPNDGRPETRFAIIDQDVTFHRLHYDAARAASAMADAGLVQGYDAALLSGRWPSEDVLPPELRSHRDDLKR